MCRKGESWQNRKTVKCILITVVWNKNKQKRVIVSGRQNEARKRFVRVLVGAAYLWWHARTCTIFFESSFQRSSTNINSTTDFRYSWQRRVLRTSKQNTKTEVFVWSTMKKTILWDLHSGKPARTSIKKRLDTLMNKIQLVVFENKEFDYQEKLKIFSLAGSVSP